MQELKFVPSTKRYKVAPLCPCGKDNRNLRFTPYEGHTDKGYCHSCGETFLPDLPNRESRPHLPYRHHVTPPKPIITIPDEYFRRSVAPANLKAIQEQSSLFKGLINNKIANIPDDEIRAALNRYYVGYSNFQFRFYDYPTYESARGAIIFWLIDEERRIRGGQIVLFDSNSITVSTLKSPDRHTRPVYKAIKAGIGRNNNTIPQWITDYEEDAEKIPCLFGIPALLKAPKNKIVALCEAPKTAIIGSIYFPEMIWLSVGAKGNLSAKRCQSLKGRDVILFPDLSTDGSTFALWEEKAAQLQKELGGHWSVNSILENASDLTPEERKGCDIADYFLTRYDWREFREKIKEGNTPNVRKKPESIPVTPSPKISQPLQAIADDVKVIHVPKQTENSNKTESLLDQVFGEFLSINRANYYTRCKENNTLPDVLIESGLVKPFLNHSHFERETWNIDTEKKALSKFIGRIAPIKKDVPSIDYVRMIVGDMELTFTDADLQQKDSCPF
jgi:hypothetical protein